MDVMIYNLYVANVENYYYLLMDLHLLKIMKLAIKLIGVVVQVLVQICVVKHALQPLRLVTMNIELLEIKNIIIHQQIEC